jgi:hypothetical protein
MEKLQNPLRYIFISQGMNTGNHSGRMAIDFAAKDKENQKCYMPFTGIVRGKASGGENWVWVESKEPVLSASGIVDYFCLLSIHDNDISHLKIGQEIKQSVHYYTMGTAGQATGIHVHLELARGRYADRTNRVDPTKHFFITEDTQIVKSQYKWTSDYTITPINATLKVLSNNVRQRLIPSTVLNETVKGNISQGEHNVLETTQNDGYAWAYTGEYWVALIDGATELVQKVNELDKLTEENEFLREKVKQLEEHIEYLQNKWGEYEKVEVLVRR